MKEQSAGGREGCAMSAKWSGTNGHYWLYPETGTLCAHVYRICPGSWCARVTYKAQPDSATMDGVFVTRSCDFHPCHNLTHTVREAKAWAVNIINKVDKGDLT